MSGLSALSLQETSVGDAGVSTLAPLAPNLERLYLGYTQVSDACVPVLQTFKRLRTLMLRATAVDGAHDRALAAALPTLGGVGTGAQGIQEGLSR